jgi:predicted RNase H-like HicB family nuclease
MRQVIIYPGEDGYWVAECPSLPSCISQGKTKQEAIVNIREAIRGYIAALEAAYEQMAQDEEREAEALEWAEATLGDVSDEMR